MLYSFLTALCTVSAIVCAVCCYLAMRAYDRAAQSEAGARTVHNDLQQQRASIVALEREADQHARSLKKLHGRVAHLPTFDEWQEMQGIEYSPVEEQLDAFKPIPMCENWQRAQVEGPLSEWAKCVCPFCEGQRARRRSVLPASVTAKVGS